MRTCGSYGLSLSLSPQNITLTQGKSGNVAVSAENTGDIDLENLKLFASGEALGLWYGKSPLTIDVNFGSTDNFTVNFNISKNSPVGIYEMTYKVNNSKVSSSADGELRVEPTENKTEDINQTYQSLKRNVTEISKKVGRILHTKENTTELNQTYQSLLEKAKEAGTALNKGNYAVANERMDEVKSLYSDVEKEIKELEGKRPNYLLWIGVGVVVIVIVSLLVYILLPPKEGYHPEKGYQYKKPGEEKPHRRISKTIRETIEKFKEKIGLRKKHGYDYKGRKKWKPKEEE